MEGLDYLIYRWEDRREVVMTPEIEDKYPHLVKAVKDLEVADLTIDAIINQIREE